MILSYFQNSDARMSKEAYFEMCEMLNSDPIESEIPVDISDFPQEVQKCFSIYSLLSDRWDSMSGVYFGKEYANLFNYFDLFNIDSSEYLFYISILRYMDSVRSDIIESKRKK